MKLAQYGMWLGRRDAEVAANPAHGVHRNLAVPGDCCFLVRRGVDVDGVFATFALQHAAVAVEVPQYVKALHGNVTVISSRKTW